MRENYRKPIASKEKFPQFITMKVIDGQAGLARYSSLIFYSLTINNILNIIILVILAAVSIRAVYNMGIVGHAINGTQQYAERAVEENAMFGETTSKIDQAVAKVKEIQNGGSSSTTENQTESEEGTLLAALKAGTVKVGDYINYQAPAVSAEYGANQTGAMVEDGENEGVYIGYDQTFTISQADSAKMGWRILGYGDSQGRLTTNPENATNVLLIAANPIQTGLVLGREQAYLNGPTVMNDLSSKFGSSGVNAATNFTTSQTTARSVNIEDINTALGVTVDVANGTVTQNNTDLVTGGSAEVYNGTYTYQDTNWRMTSSGVEYVSDASGLAAADKTVTGDAYYYMASPSGDSDVIGHMLLDGTTDTDNYVKSYWLASRGVKAGGNGANFGPDCVNNGVVFSYYGYWFNTDGGWRSFRFGVRPVVSLASGIKYGTGTGELTKTNAPTGWTGQGYAQTGYGQYTAPVEQGGE